MASTGEVTREQAQTAFSRILLEKIRQDRNPSYTQMRLLEQTIPPSLHREYLTILLEKVMDDNTPSTTMLRKIQRFMSEEL